ncbi:MAG: hypothetical protein CMF72_24650 [Mameliella sp.]|nr:hypothetical protein [Mameliella sp.]
MTTKAKASETRLKRRNYGRGHGYLLDGTKIEGVTGAIDVLDKPALRNWYAEQAAKRAVDEWDRLTDMSVSDRLEYIKWGPRDKVRAAALRGTQIHDLGQQLADGGEVDVPDEHRGPVEAYARWLDKWDVETIATETPLVSVTHKYGGTADLWGRVGALDGAVCLLDVKTGKGVYNETALQLAAYRYAELMQPEPGVEIAVPAVDAVYVAHVLPDDVRMLPVIADESTFRTFLYVLHVSRQRKSWDDWPLIGAAVQPGEVEL